VTTLDGAQVAVELGEQANVNLIGIVGPVGPQGPIGPPGGPMAGYFTPQQFGAVGDGVHNDTAGVQAAIAAAGTNNIPGKGGVVYFPPGNYICTAQLQYYPSTMWVGAGVGASVIHLSTELWNGVAASPARFIVRGPVAMTQGSEWKIANLSILGPGTGTVLGRVRSHTNGIQSASGIIIDNVFVSGFFAGLEIIADHEKVYNLYSTGNYYGVEFSDAKVTAANQAFYALAVTGNGLASIHVSGASDIEAATFSQVHLGVCPVGIFVTDNQNGWDGSGNPVYTGGPVRSFHAIVSTRFSDTVFEQIGNCCILDISTGGNATLMWGTTLAGEGHISWGPAVLTTNPPLNNAAYQQAWAIMLRNNSTAARIDQGYYPFKAGSLGVLNQNGFGTPIFTFAGGSGPPANFFGSGAAASGWSPAVKGYAVLRAGANLQYGTGSYWGDAYVYTSSSVINVGDLVEVAGNGVVQRASGTKPVVGIALTPTPGALSVPVMVLVGGVGTMNATVNSIPGGNALYLDATTTYMVNNTNTSGHVVGLATANGGTGNVTGTLRFGSPG
jgi:hypothetical protein